MENNISVKDWHKVDSKQGWLHARIYFERLRLRKLKSTLLLIFSIATSPAFFAGAAPAATFANISSFSAATSSLSVEGFEVDAFGFTQSNDFGDFTLTSPNYTFSVGDTSALVVSGSKSLHVREDHILNFVFGTAVTAIGFEIKEMTWGTVDYEDNAGNSVDSAIGPNGTGTTFFGLTSDVAFDQFTLTITGGTIGHLAGLDNLRYGDAVSSVTPVPLPAALPLLVGGLGLMGIVGWRRKTR